MKGGLREIRQHIQETGKPPFSHHHTSSPLVFLLNFLNKFYLFVWLQTNYLFVWVLLRSCDIFGCGMWDQVPDQGWEPGPQHWEHRLLVTGPPGNPHPIFQSMG